MRTLIGIFLLIPLMAMGAYHSTIKPVSPALKKRMLRGGSWKKGCPVPLSDLRYLRMTYRGFDERDHSGEMVVHKNVAKEVTQIFGTLYRAGYPIHRMRLVDDYGASDYRSIEADNTSAFNCRKEMGGRRWSPHAFGQAIDINPIENPYVFRDGHVSHPASKRFVRRRHGHRSVILPGDPIVKTFRQHGWSWRGNAGRVHDYQHFQKGTTPKHSSLLGKVGSLFASKKNKKVKPAVSQPVAKTTPGTQAKRPAARPKHAAAPQAGPASRPVAKKQPSRPKEPATSTTTKLPAPAPTPKTEVIDVDALFD